MEALTFGLVQSYTSGGPKLADAAQGFALVVGEAAKLHLEPDFSADYQELLEKLARSEVHLAWTPPLVHAKATEAGAYLAAVSERDGSYTYRSAILVATGSDYQRARDLRGVRLAWVDPHSAAGHTFPRLELLLAGLDAKRDFVSERFYGSVSLAAQAVVDGEADACACHVRGGAGNDRASAQHDVRTVLGALASRLRVVHVTDSIPPDGMVIAGGVDAHTRDVLRETLLALNLSSRGRKALKELLGADSLVPATDQLLSLMQRWAKEAESRAAEERQSPPRGSSFPRRRQ